MKKLLLFISTLLCSFSSYSQNQKDSITTIRGVFAVDEQYKKYIPNYSPQSPNASASLKHGDYEVNLATGVPNISIPIYTISVGEISVPISLKYHSSGFKMKELASWVGWGWSLDYGSPVNRTVQGLPDDNGGSTGDNYLNDPILSSRDFCNVGADYTIGDGARKNLVDLEPDIYSYGTFKSSGRFILGQNGASPFVIPWQPIKINKMLNFLGHISAFEIIDSDGTAYDYGLDANGNSISETQNNINGRWTSNYISTWNLSKIKSPNTDDKVEFFYQSGGSVNQYDRQWSASIIANVSPIGSTHYINSTTAEANPSSSSSASTFNHIQKITFPNGEIEFIQSSVGETRSDMPTSHYLKQIKIYTFQDGVKVLLRTVDFTYSYFKNASNQDARLKLDKVAFKGSDGVESQEYVPEYFTNSFAWTDNVDDLKKQDFFGYYNGQNNQSLISLSTFNVGTVASPNNITISNGGANRETLATYMKQGVLSKLTYPSGGFTTFDFEPNHYKVATTDKLAGGLRVKEIKSFQSIGAKPIMKRYVYSSDEGLGIGKLPTNWTPDTSNFVVMQNLFWSNPIQNGETATATQYIISPHSQKEIGSFDAAPVYYTKVVEYFEEDTATVKNGKNEYLFSFEKDVLFNPSYNNSKNLKNYKRGQLTNKKTFNVSGLLIAEKSNTYQDFKVSSVLAGGYVSNANVYEEGGEYNTSCTTAMNNSSNGPELVYYAHYYFTGQSKLISSTETIDSVSITQTLIYDDNLLVKTTTTDDSYTNHFKISETVYVTDASYSADAVATELKNRNMIDIPLESIEKENLNGTINTLSKQKTVYNIFSGNNARGLTNNILPKEIWVAPTGGTLEKRVEYVAYDADGNPLEYKQDEVSTSLVWGYNNNLLIGLVKNATAGQVSTALSSTGLNAVNFSVTNLSNAQITTLGNFRNTLPNTQVSWFTHIPNVGMSNGFSPNGLRTSYEYDSFQRFSAAKDHEGNLLTTNFYKVSPTENYIRSASLRVPTSNPLDALSFNNAKIIYQLVDGLGRQTQTLGYGQTPDFKTILGTEISYDRWGRTIQNLLPVSAGTLTFSPISNGKSLAQSFYNDTTPTDSTIYEASPLNRTKANFGAGEAWRTNNKKTQVFYESAGSDVRYYTVNGSNSVILNGFYPAKSLFKKRIIDEQGNTSIEITDKRGRLVQKQAQKDNSGNWLTTYYCYDGLGRTRAILQPMAYNLNQTIGATDQAHRDFVFAFEYDSRGRLIREDIPGAEERYSVYDKRDHLVMQKDALQSESGKWNFWKYDAFDREVMRGETGSIGFNQSYWASLFASHTPINETWGSGGYDGLSYPSAVNNALEIKLFNFYDDYDFVNILYTNSFFGVNSGTYDFVPHGSYSSAHLNQRGLLTGTLSFDVSNNDIWYANASYRDTKNRVIQNYRSHILADKNTPNRTDLEYNFAGEVLKERALIRNVNESTKTRIKEYIYDHVGRRTQFKLGINSSTEKILQYSYDPIGRQITKLYYPDRTYRQADSIFDYIFRPPNPDSNTTDLAKRAINLLPGTSIIADSTNFYLAHIDTLNIPSSVIMAGMQKMDFDYHIRGLINCVNCQSNIPTLNALENDLFANKLEWETAGRYDANIGKQTWKNKKDEKIRIYSYQYDPSSRMISANYGGSGNEDYSLSHLSFDDNGNILKLKRQGFTGSSFGDVDNLTYTYNGNRSKAITDSVMANLNTKDFRDSSAIIDYQYYANGNLKSDLNKGIGNIEYNTYLNKPQKITLLNEKELTFNYDGSGMLISRIITDSTKWHYTPDEIYKDDSLYQISQEEGRITRKNGKYKFEFEYRDIWGNLRTSFADSDSLPVSGVYPAPIVLQINDYDPLGFQHFNNQLGSNNKLFQYQERVFDLDLGVDFFKYRVSDPVIGRFWGPDPIGKQYPYNSLYAFQENKFGRGVELEGLELADFFKGYLAAKVDNYSGGLINLRSTFKPQNIVAYNSGQDVGDLQTAAEGAALEAGGTGAAGVGGGMMASSLQLEVSSGGTATVVAGPGVVAGAVIGTGGVAGKIYGKMLQSSGNSNYGSQKDRANPKKAAREEGRMKREQQPASEKRGKDAAKDLEKREGPDARRKAHDAKKSGEPDRTKKQLNEDYGTKW